MENLEWLEKVRKTDGDKVILEYRKIKALEIIAEELILFNKNFNNVIGGSVTHSIRTMSMIGG